MRTATRAPAPVRVVFDGQSLNLVPIDHPELSFPARVMAGRGIPWHNAAVSGVGWAWLAGDASTRLFPQARARVGCTDILVMQGGQTDIFLNHTGAEVYDLAVDYAIAARSAGFDKVILTTMPAMGPTTGSPPVPTAPQWAEALAHNVLVRSNSGGFDGVADLYQGALTDATNPTYYMGDRLHFVAAGAQVAANIIAPVLDVVLDSISP